MNPILLVEDDRELCGLLSDYLKPESLSIEAVHDGETGVQSALSGNYDLVVLDVMLPELNGFEVLKRIREKCDLPVLMLSGRNEDVDRIVGLEMGADDYLPKPFIPRELVARIRAILRRTQASMSADASRPERLSADGIVLDTGSRELLLDGAPVGLTTAEFDILELLVRRAGHAVSRDTLAENVLGRKFHPLDRSIDMHISNLRKKLGRSDSGNERIRTVRGIGYMLCVRAD